MSGRFPFKMLGKYPHMKSEDVLVWDRFCDQQLDYFDTVDYDVPVGTGAEAGPEHEPNIQADWKILTQKKIDVVGYKGGRTTVVEVKPVADMRALGQIIAYSHLYAQDHPEAVPLTRLVVCGAIERELDAIYAAQGVEWVIAAPIKLEPEKVAPAERQF